MPDPHLDCFCPLISACCTKLPSLLQPHPTPHPGLPAPLRTRTTQHPNKAARARAAIGSLLAWVGVLLAALWACRPSVKSSTSAESQGGGEIQPPTFACGRSIASQLRSHHTHTEMPSPLKAPRAPNPTPSCPVPFLPAEVLCRARGSGKAAHQGVGARARGVSEPHDRLLGDQRRVERMGLAACLLAPARSRPPADHLRGRRAAFLF